MTKPYNGRIIWWESREKDRKIRKKSEISLLCEEAMEEEMKKRKYIPPQWQILPFFAEDIICSSNDWAEDEDDDWWDDEYTQGIKLINP